MKSVIRATLASALLVLAGSVGAVGLSNGAMVSVASYAPSIGTKASEGTKKPKKHKAAKKSKGGNVTFHEGSAESRSERDRRLMRECKGRSNSGVCEGYTR